MDIWGDGPRSGDSWISMCVARIRLSFKIKLRIGLRLLGLQLALDLMMMMWWKITYARQNICQTEVLMCVCRSMK